MLSDLRAIKDAEEVELLRRAAHAADRAVTKVASGRLIGRTEADIAREVRERLVNEGHDEAAFWIVASGPNSASPHHEPGERGSCRPASHCCSISAARIEGYGSDITRTFWVTGDGDAGPSDEFRRLYDVLQEAQAASTGRRRPAFRPRRSMLPAAM